MSDRSRQTADEQNREDLLDPRDLASEDLLGRRQWRRSKLGYLTGAGAFTDGLRGVAATGGAAQARLGSLFGAVFGKQRQDGVSIWDDVEGEEERFHHAMIANGKTDHDIARSIKNTYAQFMLFAALGAAAVLWGLGNLAFGQSRLGVAGYLFNFIPVLPLSILALRAGFTNWMFRRRRLDTIPNYLKSGEIMPMKAAPKRKGRARSVVASSALILFILAGSLAPAAVNVAYAADASDTSTAASELFDDPNSKDLFLQLMAYVIPEVGPVPANPNGNTPGTDALKTGFMAFSATLMFIGSVVFSWQLLSGLVASAKEGKALGQQYHEVWAPVRTVIGFGMLAPVAGGLCAAQVIVLYLIVWGGNLANIVWKPYVATITATAPENPNDPSNQDDKYNKTIEYGNLYVANDVVKNLFQKELCYWTYKTYNTRIGRTDPSVPTSVNWTSVPASTASYYFGSNIDSQVLDYGRYCGKATIEYKSPTSTDATDEEKAARTLALARKDAIETMRSQLSNHAKTIAESYQDPNASQANAFAEGGVADPSVLEAARKGYSSSIIEASKNTASTQSAAGRAALAKLVKQASDSGWAESGTLYLTISRVQSTMYNSLAEGVTFSSISPGAGGRGGNVVMEYLYGKDDKPGIIPAFGDWWSANILKITPAISTDAAMAADESGSFASTMNKIFPWLVEVWDGNNVNPLNAMQAMIDFGNKLMYWGVGSFIAAASIKGAAEGMAGSGTVVDYLAKLSIIGGAAKGAAMAIIQSIGTVAMFIVMAMIAAGAIHAYVLPMIPYIMVTFFVCSMLLLVVESLVAAPLWAFFHIRMDGQEFVDQVQKPGYMIAFNLILRPVLMIFGLILSYLTFGAMAWFVGKTFVPAMKGLAASATLGPIGVLVMIGMVTYIHFQLGIRSFQMILQVPDRVTRWFGQGGENLNEDHDTKSAMAFFTREAQGRVEGIGRGTAARGSLGGGGGRPQVKGPDVAGKMSQGPAGGAAGAVAGANPVAQGAKLAGGALSGGGASGSTGGSSGGAARSAQGGGGRPAQSGGQVGGSRSAQSAARSRFGTESGENDETA